MEMVIGALIDERYELKRRLGTGASGEVWLARDRLIPRIVALKIMNTSLMASGIALERFQREVHSLNELGQTHPNIPQLYGANLLAERPYFVMEYIGGYSLGDLMTNQTLYKIPFELRISRIIQQLADALTFAHDKNIVHRDIKPENVKILGNADKTYLLDFSVAVLDGATTHTGIGTPRYIAPELRTSEAADIFSLAIVIFEILFGVHPIFEASDGNLRIMKAQKLMSERLASGNWKHPSQLSKTDKSLPTNIDWKKIDAVFERALSVKTTERPDNAQSFVEGLQAALQQESTSELVISMLSTGRQRIGSQNDIGAVFDSGAATVLEPAENDVVKHESKSRQTSSPETTTNQGFTTTSNMAASTFEHPEQKPTVDFTRWFVLALALILGIVIGALLF